MDQQQEVLKAYRTTGLQAEEAVEVRNSKTAAVVGEAEVVEQGYNAAGMGARAT